MTILHRGEKGAPSVSALTDGSKCKAFHLKIKTFSIIKLMNQIPVGPLNLELLMLII